MQSKNAKLINKTKNILLKKRSDIFNKKNISAAEKIIQYTKEVDSLLIQAYSTFINNKELDKEICIIALGGYGRMELCPHSDIDILVLHSSRINEEKISRIVRFFWDIGFNLGCTVRSIKECCDIIGNDIATDTSFLQQRFLAGNKKLFLGLNYKVVKKYFQKKKNVFIKEMVEVLKEGVFSAHNTLFRVEPDIKNGICTLRDCQRILWAEKVREGSISFDDLHNLSHYPLQTVNKFKNAYHFLLNIRNNLHVLTGRRIDVLEINLQYDIAESMGLGDAAVLMENFYKSVRDIKNFILLFIERSINSNSIWNVIYKKIAMLSSDNGVYLFNGILYPDRKKILIIKKDPLWILNIFKTAIKCHSTLSLELNNLIKRCVENISDDDFISDEIDMIFKEVLSSDNYTGQTLMLMHDCDLLGKILPEFRELICKVEYDSYHEYTVDQHILLCLTSLDDLDNNNHFLYAVYNTIAEKFLLKLGILLHDIGKGFSGDHKQTGAVIAENICDRLGLNELEKNKVIFLIFNHLEMSRLSLTRELEDHLIMKFASTVKNKENLDMLYILTVLDIQNVGSKTWTEWKGIQLNELYNKTLAVIEGGVNNSSIIDNWKIQTDLNIYSNIFNNTEKEIHEKLLNELSKNNPNEIEIYFENFNSFERVIIVGYDRKNLFMDIVGCLSSEGYNILNAKVFSSISNKVLDVFHLEADDILCLSFDERKYNVRKKLEKINNGITTALELIEERYQKYPLKKTRKSIKNFTKVSIDNETSSTKTIVEVITENRFGLLFKICMILSECKFNIDSAKLSTRIDRAVDVFYITDFKNNKIINDVELNKLEEKLLNI